MPTLSGISIYLPLLFFKDLGIGTVIGVGMHWCQYIALMWTIYLRKGKIKSDTIKNDFIKNKKFISAIIFVGLYSLIMSSFTLIGMPQINSINNNYSSIYLINIISFLPLFI